MYDYRQLLYAIGRFCMENDGFKALSDPTRRKILEILAHEGDMTAGDIASRFDMSAPSISHHLSILRNTGLIADTRQRQSIIYSFNADAFRQVAGWFLDILGQAPGND